MVIQTIVPKSLPENAYFIIALENSGPDIVTTFKPAILAENFTTT